MSDEKLWDESPTSRQPGGASPHLVSQAGYGPGTYYHILRKNYNMYAQPPPFRTLLCSQMQNETTDYCCQNFLKTSSSLTSHHTATWYKGKRHHAGVYQ